MKNIRVLPDLKAKLNIVENTFTHGQRPQPEKNQMSIDIERLARKMTMDIRYAATGEEAEANSKRYLLSVHREAKAEAFEEAAAIIIRATEIPRGCRNPTRDLKVIHGEELAHLLRHHAAALRNPTPKEKTGG